MLITKILATIITVLSVLFTLFTNTIYAQVTKGNWLVGGTGRFDRYKIEYDFTSAISAGKYTQIDVSPNIGYFILDKFAIGLKPRFTLFKGRELGPGGGYTNSQRYWIGPLVRYYFLSTDQPLNIVSDVSYQLGFLRSSGQKGNLSTFSAYVGPAYFFNSSVGLELLLGYSYTKDDIKLYQITTRNGVQVSVGIQVHLER